MKTILKDNRGITLVVVLMVMAIMLSVVGAGLLFSGINTKVSANYQTGTKAFNAADTGINAGVSQLPSTTAIAETAISGTSTSYQSESIQLTGTAPLTGYSLGAGTGYNQAGYTFHQYQMTMKGYFKPGATALATRRVEARAVYGPVAK
jgi:Tfp pilus assembly protein PilX